MGKASKNLFDDDNAETGAHEENLTLGVNPEYAARLEVGHHTNEGHLWLLTAAREYLKAQPLLRGYVSVQHNKQREEWHRLKEKNPRLAARIEVKAAGGVVESDTDKTEDSSDDDDDDEVRLFFLLL